MMQDNVPADSYKFFVRRLMNTIRDEIASCMEVSYAEMPVRECGKMLQLDARHIEMFTRRQPVS